MKIWQNPIIKLFVYRFGFFFCVKALWESIFEFWNQSILQTSILRYQYILKNDSKMIWCGKCKFEKKWYVCSFIYLPAIAYIFPPAIDASKRPRSWFISGSLRHSPLIMSYSSTDLRHSPRLYPPAEKNLKIFKISKELPFYIQD